MSMQLAHSMTNEKNEEPEAQVDASQGIPFLGTFLSSLSDRTEDAHDL